MNITGAIFDFDGTVFDSMHIWKGVKFQFFDRIGLVLSEQDKKDFSKLFLLDAIELAKERFDLGLSDKELFDEFFSMIKEIFVFKTKLTCYYTTIICRSIINKYNFYIP